MRSIAFTISVRLRHSAIQEMETDFLYHHISDTAIVSRLPSWFQSLEKGELHDGAGAVFASVMNKLIIKGATELKCPNRCSGVSRCNDCGLLY